MSHPLYQDWWFNGSNICEWTTDYDDVVLCSYDRLASFDTDVFTDDGLQFFSNGILHVSPADDHGQTN